MVEISISLIAGILSVIASIYVTYLCYDIYRYNRLNRAWLAVAAGFLLVIARRTIGFITSFGYLPHINNFLKSIEGLLLLVISLLYIYGFLAMRKQFSTFEIVEKKVKEKLK